MGGQLGQKGPEVWMEIKFVLEPEEYRILRKEAWRESLNVAELVKQIIRAHIENEPKQ